MRSTVSPVHVAFVALAGLAALALIPHASSGVALRLPIGGLFGDMTFVADGLGVFLAAVAWMFRTGYRLKT